MTTDIPASTTSIGTTATKSGKKDGRSSTTSFSTSKNKKLRIDSSFSNNTSKNAARKSLNPSPSGAAASSSISTTPTAQDSHPYARGSVIEVLHYAIHSNHNNSGGSKLHKAPRDDDAWWSEPDSSDEDVDETNDSINDDNNNNTNNDNQASRKTNNNKTIRLVDIIDRSCVEGKWRYYVHYRDFNRRMDEWIGTERIVSPPSVGNAKARALKKKQKNKHPPHSSAAGSKSSGGGASTVAAATITTSAGDGGVGGGGVETSTKTAPRSRRRSSIQQQQDTTHAAPSETTASKSSSLHIDAAASVAAACTRAASELATTPTAATAGSASSGVAAAGPGTGVAAAAAGGGGRRRRASSRRKFDATTVSDDATVVASNIGDSIAYNNDDSVSTLPQQQAQSQQVKKNQIILTDAAVTTHTVGEHVVATVHAQELDEHEGLDEASLREHEEVTKVKNVNFLELGEFQMETWYFSPLPKELCYPHGFLEVLYVCEFTFSMFARKSELRRFQSRFDPQQRHPPGNEIYRCGNLSMFEVDGLEEKIYCQNLCYIAKLFLDHKTLYFDVDPFLFYVLCEVDDRGFHPVGYFSKEKYSDVGYNLACILTFPAHQRKGYGRFLISFSYELSKKEEKVGSPEKPMSDLGQQAYKPYWASTIVDFLLHQSSESRLSIMDISKKTSIMAEDIVFTLNQLGILKIINGGVYLIAAEKSLLERLALRYPIKEPRVDPTKLHWTPFLTDVKRDKFSIHSKKPSVEAEEKKVQ